MASTTPDAGDTEVLVVGAGPVGLSLAVDLTRRGVAVRIVDALAEPTDESRAIVVHSRTLDHFRALGVLDEILQRSIRSTGMEVHAADSTMTVTFDHIHAVHPYSVSLVQSDTEAVLAARLTELGVDVERATTLTACTSSDDHVHATITSPDGGERSVRVAFLVGADGARSAVRHLTGQELDGSFAGEDVMLGDVDAEHDYELSHFHAFFSPGDTSALLFPLRDQRVRVFAQLPDGTDPSRAVTVDWLQQVAAERGIRIRITRAHWLTRFELKHGLVPQYRVGRVFLAGDAAHIHSPAGALGMNTGIQDAINLGWKLATALGEPSEHLLDSYHLERHPVGKDVVASTTAITRVATLHNPLAQRARNALMHLGMHAGSFVDRMADTIEQQHVHYRRSPVVGGGGHTLRPGDFLYLPGTDVGAALAGARDHVAITFTEAGQRPARSSALPELTIAPADAVVLRRATGLHGNGIVIVRPDGYVGHVGADVAAAERHYRRAFSG